MLHTNGTTPHTADEMIDTLYSFWPGARPAPQPCPEAPFSLTLKGALGGHEALLTARGSTAAEFKANIEAIKGLLDAVPAKACTPVPTQEPGEGSCAVHATTMYLNHGKDGRTWYSHRLPEGGFCKGKVRQ